MQNKVEYMPAHYKLMVKYDELKYWKQVPCHNQLV